MTITIPLGELSYFIKKKFDKQLQFDFISAKTLEVTYSQDTPFGYCKAFFKVHIEYVNCDSIMIRYEGRSESIDKIIEGILQLMNEKSSESRKVFFLHDNKQLRIELSRLATTATLVESVDIQDITVTEKGLQITSYLK